MSGAAMKHPVVAACVVAGAAWAQSAWAQSVPAFRSHVDLVEIPCAVVDAKGAPVDGLTREDFRVTDNGVRRIVENLWLDTEMPLALGVLIDASESQREQLAEHRQTAMALFQRILQPGDRAFAISVDEDVRLWADLTDAAGLRERISHHPIEPFGQPCPKAPSGAAATGLRPISACGASPLWNAIYDAARVKLAPLKGIKALLILTDGFDTGSTHTWRQAVDEAQKADATVYAIQYRSGLGGGFAPVLYKLVAEAGGTCFPAPAVEYGAIVSRLETDLRRRYVLGFRPEALSGKVRHDVQVEVTRPDLTVRARKTYFQVPR
jgi:VWFA-related protein